jgi:hypothetical protein
VSRSLTWDAERIDLLHAASNASAEPTTGSGGKLGPREAATRVLTARGNDGLREMLGVPGATPSAVGADGALPVAMVEAVYAWAIRVNLSSLGALRTVLAADLVASLPTCSAPGAQLLSDLVALNRIAVADPAPLLRWLTWAETLAGAHPSPPEIPAAIAALQRRRIG